MHAKLGVFGPKSPKSPDSPEFWAAPNGESGQKMRQTEPFELIPFDLPPVWPRDMR